MGLRSPFKNEFPPAKVTPEGVRGTLEVGNPLVSSLRKLESEELTRHGKTDPLRTLFNVALAEGNFFAPGGAFGEGGRFIVEDIAKQRTKDPEAANQLASGVAQAMGKLNQRMRDMGVVAFSGTQSATDSMFAPPGRKATDIAIERFRASFLPDLFRIVESGQDIDEEGLSKLIRDKVLERQQARKRRVPVEKMHDVFRESADEFLRKMKEK